MAGKAINKASGGHKAENEWIYTYPSEFTDSLARAITLAGKNFTSGALLIVELENIAMLVQAHGHEKCEEVISDFLTQVANLIDGDGSSVFRIQRNQFGVICQSCEKDEAMSIAGRVNNLAHNFGSMISLPVHLITHIGSVDFPGNAKNALEAIDKALVALYDRNALDFASYVEEDESAQKSIQQMQVAQYLTRSIQQKKLKLSFQPIIESKTGKIKHYEALLRVIGDDGKVSSAGALIPIAEKMGLINIIDHMVLEMVVKELKSAPDINLAFNLSNLSTSDEKWFSRYMEIAGRYPDIANRMIVEITETALSNDLRETAYFIASLQETGCRVALDDFGSGYTSFRQLKSLSVDVVKIDGAFIKDLVDNPDNRFFVKTLLDFTNGFGLETIAKCVETGEVAKLLMELGVTHMQGFYFSRPHLQRPWLTGGEYSKEA